MIVMCTLNSPYHCILLSHLLQTFAISSILTLLYLSCFFTLSKKIPTEIPETKLSSALINDDDPEIMSPLTPHLSKTETWASCTQSLSVSSDLLSHNISVDAMPWMLSPVWQCLVSPLVSCSEQIWQRHHNHGHRPGGGGGRRLHPICPHGSVLQVNHP